MSFPQIGFSSFLPYSLLSTFSRQSFLSIASGSISKQSRLSARTVLRKSFHSSSRTFRNDYQRFRPRGSYSSGSYSHEDTYEYIPYWKTPRFLLTAGTGAGIIGVYYVSHLETVPISNRRRYMDISPKFEERMAKQAYTEVMNEFQNRILPLNHPYTIYIRQVAQRIINAAGMSNLNWEFYVIDAPEQKNAFVLPGGKVFVFTGILGVVENEDGLAAVLGHEIAHQLARHSAEKLSFAKILILIQLILTAIIGDPGFIFNRLILDFAFLMPFSRKCETEADIIGLQLMSQACFDPREAPLMWKRMEALEKNMSRVPGFLSTHPAPKERVKKLEEMMPVALQQRAASDCYSMIREHEMFRDTWARW